MKSEKLSKTLDELAKEIDDNGGSAGESCREAAQCVRDLAAFCRVLGTNNPVSAMVKLIELKKRAAAMPNENLTAN